MQFKIQQDYIVAELCEKREEVNNTCNGNCYLKEHLTKQGEQSSTAVSYLKDKIELYFNFSDFSLLVFCMKTKNEFPDYFLALQITRCKDIFHPPA